jgi:hypothetical protein
MLKCCNGKSVALRRLVPIRFAAVFEIVILSGFFASLTAFILAELQGAYLIDRGSSMANETIVWFPACPCTPAARKRV